MRPIKTAAVLSFAVMTGCASYSDHRHRTPYGVWQGTLPCADCPGIETRLSLYKDPYTYRLEETYLERSEEAVANEGEWALLPPLNNMDLGRIALKEDNTNEANGTNPLRQLQRLPGGNLEMLDRNGQPIRSDLNYTLERKRVSQ